MTRNYQRSDSPGTWPWGSAKKAVITRRGANAHDHPVTDAIQHIQETPQDRCGQQLDRLHKHLLRSIVPGRLPQGEVCRANICACMAKREVTFVRWRRIRRARFRVGVCALKVRGFGGGEERGTFRRGFLVYDGRRSGSGTRGPG